MLSREEPKKAGCFTAAAATLTATSPLGKSLYKRAKIKYNNPAPGCWNVIQSGLKNQWEQSHEGSIPSPGTMRIIFLNIWGGQVFEPLMQFIQEHARSTDFFCFQEVLDSPTPGLTPWGGKTDIRKKLQEALLEFQEYYAPSHNILDKNGNVDPTTLVGVAIFAKQEIEVKSQGRLHVQGDPSGKSHDDRQGAPHYFQYVRFEHNEKPYTLCNMHGTAYPGDKLDTPERLEQSKRIVDFLSKETGEKILGGDFNLLPSTESIGMIERMGMKELVREYKIETTRSELNYKRYPNNIQYFSDYVFVSSDIKVTSFEVPQLNISDHLPLVLEFA